MDDRRRTESLVDAWGDLGVMFGVPRTTARIQALLLASDEPLSLQEVAERLGISKGGASMRLKDLREWGVVQRVSVSDDRRDYHVASQDVWGSFLAMAKARKEREFDPVAEKVRRALAARGRGADRKLRGRLSAAREILDTLDGLGSRLLASGPATRALLRLLAGRSKP